ncbi:hypothetical protein LINPERPRIM_LOCUS16975 [Linum perenne]
MAHASCSQTARDGFNCDDDEVLCYCRKRASPRIYRTVANSNRKFQVSEILIEGCGCFVWFDVKEAAMKEKQDLV